MAVISIRLPVELHDQLKAAAEENHRTMSQEARHAISRHVKAQEEATALA